MINVEIFIEEAVYDRLNRISPLRIRSTENLERKPLKNQEFLASDRWGTEKFWRGIHEDDPRELC